MLLSHLPFSNPYINAAIEEYLFRQLPATTSAFITYINAPSIHFGRHQICKFECCLKECISHKIPLLRRISGGGTVYHDYGVLNYAFIVPHQKQLSPENYIEQIASILRDQIHPDIQRDKRNSILLHENKISGSAFAIAHNRLLVHGTILIQADLSALKKFLSQKEPAPDSYPRALRSISASVQNLASGVPSLTAYQMAEILHRQIRKLYFSTLRLRLPKSKLWQNYEDKNQDLNWVYSKKDQASQ
ncbi:MAG: hypothetical protein WCS73_07040 [Lentisphaeria bacterium]